MLYRGLCYNRRDDLYTGRQVSNTFEMIQVDMALAAITHDNVGP